MRVGNLMFLGEHFISYYSLNVKRKIFLFYKISHNLFFIIILKGQKENYFVSRLTIKNATYKEKFKIHFNNKHVQRPPRNGHQRNLRERRPLTWQLRGEGHDGPRDEDGQRARQQEADPPSAQPQVAVREQAQAKEKQRRRCKKMLRLMEPFLKSTFDYETCDYRGSDLRLRLRPA